MIVRGRELTEGFEASVDVCVVGSGAGGAVVAKTLSESGLSVCVLEEGGHYRPEEYGAFRPSESLRRMGRDGGMTSALGLGDSPSVVVMAGRAVGGSSLLTGAVCFRIPDAILRDWEELGLEEFHPHSLDEAYASVEEEVHVETVPEHMRSRSTQLFLDGAAKMGVPMHALRRNTNGCDGCARCNFGCPHGAKMSVDVTYLPKAMARGTVIYSDCLVDKVITRGTRAVGVRGRVLNGAKGARGDRFRVHAKVVVVAAGSIHTPLLLKASGVGHTSGQVGRNLTLHPAFRVSAMASHDLQGWKGALQSVYSDHFVQQGITLVGVYSAANVLAAAMPGIGPSHLAYARNIGRTAVMGGMVHDEGGGRVHRGWGREPILTYRMAPKDKVGVVKGIRLLAEMALEGGATEVMLPIFGSRTVTSRRELDDLEAHPPHGSRIECTAFHPLGSARMGLSPLNSVVKTTGETHEVDNLFVADGSIFPTSIGVNSQLPIMTMATRIAWRLRDDWARLRARAEA